MIFATLPSSIRGRRRISVNEKQDNDVLEVREESRNKKINRTIGGG